MRMRLWIVDDDDLYWELVRTTVTRWGLDVELDRCIDGHVFLDRLEEPGELPDLVLLDERMPGLDGTQVLAELRRRDLFPALSVCLMTSSREPELVRKALERGARFCIEKPSSFEALKDILSKIIAFYTTVARLPESTG